jgi:pseudouridine-5'-phosphate glycosidase
MTSAAARGGALAAVTAVVHGVCTLGLDQDELERFLRRDGIRTVSARDLPEADAQRADGATTVAASLAIASAAGAQVFATGGIGGVHRDSPFDESGDLDELARTPMVVVCAGAKAILDLAATLERLETLGVTVVGYGTDEMPGFFTRTTGLPLPARADSVTEIAEIHLAARALGRSQATLVVQPPPAAIALDAETVDRAVAQALDEARAGGIRGASVTPFLLAAVERATGGRSLAANHGLLDENALLAGEFAGVVARDGQG